MSGLRGVDVASFQGPPGLWAGQAPHIAWAAVKFTELSAAGQYVNPDAGGDWQWLKDARKGRVAYLYAHPGTDPAATVALFMNELHRLGFGDNDAVAIDLEETDGKTPAEVSAWTRDVASKLHAAAGRLPMLYTYLDFAYAGNCQGLGGYPLWMSDPSSPAGHPRVPPPWKTWAIHQWSTSSPIDRDVTAWGSLHEMAAVLGRTGAVVIRHRRKPVRTTVRRAGKAVHKKVVTEPVVTHSAAAGGLMAAVATLASHAWLHLTAKEMAAVLTALPAVFAFLAAFRVRTEHAFQVAVAGLAAAGSTAALAFGYAIPAHVPLTWIGSSAPVIAAGLAYLLRGQVSPKTTPAPATAAVQATTTLAA